LTHLLQRKDWVDKREETDVHVWAAVALAGADTVKAVVPVLLEDLRRWHLMFFDPGVPVTKRLQPRPLFQLFQHAEVRGDGRGRGPHGLEEHPPYAAVLKSRHDAALAALVRLGRPALPALIVALGDKRASQRAAAAEVLIRLLRNKDADAFKAVTDAL